MRNIYVNLNLEQFFKEMPFKTFLILSSGGPHFRWRHLCEVILNLHLWFWSRCRLKKTFTDDRPMKFD